MGTRVTTITDDRGATYSLEDGEVILDHWEAPDKLRNVAIGLLTFSGAGDPGFLPNPDSTIALGPTALRGIAALIEYQEE